MKIIRILCMAALTMHVTTATAEDATIALDVRQQRILTAPGILERVAVADPAIADVMPVRDSGTRGGNVMVIGKSPGATTVTVWTRGNAAMTWRVNVRGNLQGALSGAQSADQGADVQVRGTSALLSGQAPSLLSHARTTAAASDAVGNGKILDASTIATGGVVQIDVKIVEFSKSVLKDVGFNFLFNLNRGNFNLGIQSNLAPASAAFSLLTGLSRGSFDLLSNLRLIESNGLARVLAEPSLTALSGQSASFLAGGELPIPQAGGLGTTTITYKPFGVGLTVTPTVLSSERIALKVAPEASDIDYQNAIVSDGVRIPSISTRRADTTIELGDGESFVIGGLVSRTTKSNVSKLPLLGDLPIIGTFFRNLNYTQDEKELVIIVTPRLVKPIAKGARLPLPGQAQERRDTPGNAWSSYLLGISGSDELPGFSR